METYLGEGLVSASGVKAKYKYHKRIIQPLLDLKFVESCVSHIERHTAICMDKLDAYGDKGLFDIHEGYPNFCHASIEMYNLGFKRLAKPWLHPDCIYNVLPDKIAQENIVSHLNSFIKQVIIKSWKRRKMFKDSEGNFKPIVDKMAGYIEENPNKINGEDFMNHLMTLFTAAFDTLTIVSSFAVLCFGMYPEYQEKAVKEIKEILGETPRPISIGEINKLVYLEMCIKDVLRLFPIAPYILRTTLEDYPLGRDNLQGEIERKTVARAVLKIFLCNLLQRYEIHAEGKVPDIDLRSDISLRPKDGYICKLNARMWNKGP
ncbi:hypothetical protein NQ317_015234 [Molorchus minor]|uniref:Cytochrome P450 n=1 Tax=Molorchus minor TaxID=1323400 RepID=A0ABQ9JKA8_9CUCU|nr:hypothetical protein NQ317_015234 [Molorchus minor]